MPFRVTCRHRTARRFATRYDRAAGAAGHLVPQGGPLSENAKIAKGAYQAWNDRQFDAVAEVFANGVLIIAGSGERLEGREGATKFAEMWANGFPDGKVEIDNIVAAGDQVVIQFTGRGTHSGALVSQMGKFAATNRSVTIRLCDVWTFDGGTVKTMETYFDSGSLMGQLGLLPEAVGATA